MEVKPTPPPRVRLVSRVRVLAGEHDGRIGTLVYPDSSAEELIVRLDGDDKFMKFPLSQLEACDAVKAATPPCAARSVPGASERPPDTRDRRHKLLNHETDAQKTAAQSPEEFRQRDPASLSFESIDRRSF